MLGYITWIKIKMTHSSERFFRRDPKDRVEGAGGGEARRDLVRYHSSSLVSKHEVTKQSKVNEYMITVE